MARERGLIKKIAHKRFNGDVSAAKRELMYVATSAAKRLLEEAGITEKPGLSWFVALKAVLPVFWEIVRRKDDIPTVEEVVAEVKRRYPNIITVLRTYHKPLLQGATV